MKKYNLKNNYLFAIQWNGINEKEIEELTGLQANVYSNSEETWLWLKDGENSVIHEILRDDYVVKHPGGMVEVILPEVFEELYIEEKEEDSNLTLEDLDLLSNFLEDRKQKIEMSWMENDHWKQDLDKVKDLRQKLQILINRKNGKL